MDKERRERKGGKAPVAPRDNPHLFIGIEVSNGRRIPIYEIAQIFDTRKNEPEAQMIFAKKCIKKTLRQGNASADDILTLVPSEEVKDEIRIWCKGNNIKLKEEEETRETDYERARRLLSPDQDLIDKLGSHLKQVDLARLLAVRRYRDADEETRQTLVYGTYRLLGDVLGPRRRYHYGQEQVVTAINLPDLPVEIFTDEITRNILLESEMEAALPIFQKSREEGFKYLAERRQSVAEPILQQFVADIESQYREGFSLWVPGFRRKIPGSQKDIPDASEIIYSDYPAPHQQLYAYRFLHKPEAIGRTDLLVGDPRTMKTGAFIYAMKAAGTKTPLVVCPASLRDNWEREIREKHEESVEILKVESRKEFERLAAEGVSKKPDYVILSYSLLSEFGSLEFENLLPAFKAKVGYDALGSDEGHLAKEPKTACTRQLFALSRSLPENAPRIAMSATFVVNTVEDLDEPVRMLLPYKYPNPGDFTRAARNDPHFVSALLYGNRLITRWTKEAILGDKLPPVEGGGPREEPVPFSPFHQFIYDFVHNDDTIEDRLKRGMLRQVSLDPMLIRRHYNPRSLSRMILDLTAKKVQETDERKQEIIEEKIRALRERIELVNHLFTPAEAVSTLLEAHEKFVHWKLTENIDEVFDEDFLGKIGYGKLAAWAFLNLPHGMEDVVADAKTQFLTVDWTGLKGLYSSKYRRLKQILDKKIAAGDEKIIIFSGFYKTNVTTGVEDLENLEEGEEEGFLSLYDHLRSWYGDEAVLRMDGDITHKARRKELSAREKVRRSFRLIPPKRILLASSRCARLGQDLSIPRTQANAHFKRLVELWLDRPDTAADFIQGNGRGQGPGQEIPLEIIVFSSTNPEQPGTVRYGFIDHGIAQALEYKDLIARMAIDGIPLTEEQEAFVRNFTKHLRVVDLYPQTPRNYLRERFFLDIRGKGTKKNLKYLEKVGFEGLTNEDFFVTYYPQDDETSLSGHNAKAVAEIFKMYKEIVGRGSLRIASGGSGAGILQATLGEPLINLDMMMGILQFAKRRLGGHGEFIRADLAHLPITDGVIDAFDASMMMHWTDNSPLNGEEMSERALILQELNRVIRMNGLLTITVPSTYLTPEQCGRWLVGLEKYFGFRMMDGLPSGLLRATDYRPEPISWMLNLEKIGEPNLGFSLRDLRFDFEQVVSIVQPTNGRGGGNGTFSPPQPIPHSEFEIIHPGSGERDEIVYTQSTSLEDLEAEILREEEPKKEAEKAKLNPEELISQLGVEEYAFYRRLRRLGRSRWNLEQKDADEIAVEAVSEWYRTTTQRHDTGRILTELDIIMSEILEKRKIKI